MQVLMERGVRRVVCGLIFVMAGLASASSHAAWQPIVGIPKPPFGVDETAPARPDPWDSNVAGYYYVDAQSGNDANGNGFPGSPRQTIPDPIPAGSYVELHGQFNNDINLTAQGTMADPVFVRGENSSNRPTFGRFLNIVNSTYLIVEQIKTEPENGTLGNGSSGIRVREDSDHIGIRDSEISGVGNLNRTGNVGVGTYKCYQLDPANADYCASNEFAEYIVLDNLTIHDIGDFSFAGDQDGHGVVVNGQVAYMWLLNSTMTNGSGDGIQIEAAHDSSLVDGAGGMGGNERIHHVFVGNNVAWHNKQTAYWIKHARHVVISSNVGYDFAAVDEFSEGQCTGFQYSADYFWFINNTFYNCEVAIKAQSMDNHEYVEGGAYYIGNLIYNVHSTGDLTNPHVVGAIGIRANSRQHYIINNTIVDTDIAISAPVSGGAGGTDGDGALHMFNNIIVDSYSSDLGSDIFMESVSQYSELDDTLFSGTGDALIRFNGNNRTVSTLKNASADTFGVGIQCENCIEADPGFMDRANDDYTLRGDSPARNSVTPTSSVAQDVYDLFMTLYGEDIQQDLNGITRPARTVWDMGALEADESLRPTPPGNVTAVTEP